MVIGDDFLAIRLVSEKLKFGNEVITLDVVLLCSKTLDVARQITEWINTVRVFIA